LVIFGKARVHREAEQAALPAFLKLAVAGLGEVEKKLFARLVCAEAGDELDGAIFF
jgi:hypothetical protein